jgi:hypothetical protein
MLLIRPDQLLFFFYFGSKILAILVNIGEIKQKYRRTSLKYPLRLLVIFQTF